MSHTPGPWRTEGDIIVGEDGFDVAVISVDSTYEDDNAALIAAAPELLAACEALLLYGLAIDALSLAGIADDVLNPIAKAIKKAKGTP